MCVCVGGAYNSAAAHHSQSPAFPPHSHISETEEVWSQSIPPGLAQRLKDCVLVSLHVHGEEGGGGEEEKWEGLFGP